MDWYYYIAEVVLVLQVVFLVQMYRNFRYVLSRHTRQRSWYRPRTALIVPCKGMDLDFEKNIGSFYNQDYDNFVLYFVVAEESDAAFGKLCRLRERLADDSKADEVRILVAGHGRSCSQKIHNLLYAYERISEDVEVLAFADSDACIRGDWLSHIVYPLHNKSKHGVASGYRWFVPKKNNLATLALSSVNAKIAQLLGNSRFNHVWGGSMAIRAELFKELGIDKIWTTSLSDDFSLNYAVKKAKKKVVFVPACMVASYESTTWRKLFEFGRRQFLITRVSAAGTWWFGLLSSLYSAGGLWGTAAAAVYAWMIEDENRLFYVAVPILFFGCQLARAVSRQIMIRRLLAKEAVQMRFAMAADILGFWVWSILLLVLILSSSFGRTIRWRGIKYKLLGPTETIVIGQQDKVKTGC